LDPRLIVLALGSFAGNMESVVLPVLLPLIGAETGRTLSQAGYIAFAYSIAYAVSAPVMASLWGHADRRRVLAIAQFVLGGSALAISLAPDFIAIVIGRAVLACGAVLFTSMSQATAMAISPPERRGRAVGIVLTGGTLAILVGGPVGAWVAHQYGWRTTYLVIAALALIAAIVIRMRLPAGIRGERRTLSERLAVMRVRGVPAALAMGVLLTIGGFPLSVYVTAVTVDSMRMSADVLPLLLLANGLGAVAGGIAGGYITDRLGPYYTLTVLGALMMLSLVATSALPLLPDIAVGPLWLLLFGVAGFFGWAMYTSQMGILALLAPQGVPLAVSLSLSAANVGAAVAAIIGGWVLDYVGVGYMGIVGGLFTFAALLVAFANRRTFSAVR
jgi:predicted MFS family arabinose efflux permease